MKDLGFTPGRRKRPGPRSAGDPGLFDSGPQSPRALVDAVVVFSGGVGIYAFYALQPFLLGLYGNARAFGIAGAVAAVIAGTQILAGLAAPGLRRLFARAYERAGLPVDRHRPLLAAPRNYLAIRAGAGTGGRLELQLLGGHAGRQTYLNGLIPSSERATVLSFDNLMSSAGGVVAQPALGRVADVAGYPAAYLVSAAVQALALPFLVLARKENAPSNPTGTTPPP